MLKKTFWPLFLSPLAMFGTPAIQPIKLLWPYLFSFLFLLCEIEYRIHTSKVCDLHPVDGNAIDIVVLFTS
jgi:hypothetical protein